MQKYKVYLNNELKVIIDNWEDLCSKYVVINAAGGVVYNSKNQVLMIFRNKRWDLPKGKFEVDETIKDCALREVEEETGVRNLRIVSKFENTYHIYEKNKKKILKRTYWFKMITCSTNQLIPQVEEGITKAEWVCEKDIVKKLENAYENIKQLFLDE